MKEFITSQKLSSQEFLHIANSVLKDQNELSSVSDKAKLFAKNFSKNCNLDDSSMSLPFFPSRSNLKLHNISVTP